MAYPSVPAPGASPVSAKGRDRRPTMADVAAQVGVSRALVSIVFRGAEGASDATRQRVLEAAAEIGYRPDSLAQGLRRNRSRNLGILFSLRRPFEVELVENMLPVAQAHSYDLLLGPCTPGREQDDVIDELLRYRCAGIIVVGPKLYARDLEPLTREVAVVEVGRDVTGGLVDVIRNDDASGTQQAVEHLVNLGHTAVAFVDGGDNPGAELRRDGYRSAMITQGLGDKIRVVAGGYDEGDGAAAARTLLDDLPTAVIAANDPCAIGVLDTFLRAGIAVPEDVSLVGYDDATFGRIPGVDLTSVRQDISKMAKLALTALEARLESPDRKVVAKTLRPRLIVRGTTAVSR